MYSVERVPIPDDAGRILKKNIRGTIYVYYVYDRKYLPEKKYNLYKSTTIGKVCEDDPNMMYPNPNYRKFYPEKKKSNLIYADNAATTKLDQDAFEAMVPYLTDEFGNASQPYAFGVRARKALDEARGVIAECIHAKPEEIFFTSGGTESDNWALKGIALNDYDERAIITSNIEHHAVLNACKAIEMLEHPVAYVYADEKGIVTARELKKIITDRTLMVSVMFANNEIGSIQPIEDLAKIAHENGAIFHTDAVQAVGHVPIDVEKMDIDMLSASGHKFNGPKGIGFLYVKDGIDLKPWNHGGGQEKGRRAGTENVASIVGMATALKKNCDQIKKNSSYLLKLEDELLRILQSEGLDFIRNGAKKHIPGNISLSFAWSDGEMLLHRLDLMGICVSTGSACDSKNTQVSHVLEAIKVPEKYRTGTIRVSLSKDNTSEDVQKIAQALKKILG